MRQAALHLWALFHRVRNHHRSRRAVVGPCAPAEASVRSDVEEGQSKLEFSLRLIVRRASSRSHVRRRRSLRREYRLFRD